MPPLPHHLMRAQARVADGTFHDHYSRAYRKLTETREEYASVAATLREARGKERADAEATMNAEAHAGWELHAKMGDEAHERALDRWEAQRERWEALKRAHALRFDKRPGDLAMERPTNTAARWNFSHPTWRRPCTNARAAPSGSGK